MASGKINNINKHGTFRIQVTGSSRAEITHSTTVINGSLPSDDFRNYHYMVITYSTSAADPYSFGCDGDTLIIYAHGSIT